MTQHKDGGASAAQKDGVRIIKLGQRPEDKIYTATCSNCKTEVEFKRSVARFSDDQREGAWLTVACPVCSRPIMRAV